MTRKKIVSIFLFFFSHLITAQSDSLKNNIEVYLIDSYVTPEIPHLFVLSFFTSDSCKSVVVLNNKYEFVVSAEFTDNHKVKIDLENLSFDSLSIPYKIRLTDKNGMVTYSENYEVKIPSGSILKPKEQPSILTVCCFGGIIFGLPSPTYVSKGGKGYFSLTKEIPIFSFYSTGYNYPFGYIGVEYSYVFSRSNEFSKGKRQHFIRFGYKQMFQIPKLEYISAGINYFSDLNGFNGLSPEVSVGIVRIYNVFTLFIRYRYNFQPGRSGTDFHEAAVGLYSNFFSINF